MPRPALSRSLAVFLLGAALLAPAVSAAPPRSHPAPLRSGFLEEGPLDLLARLWASFSSLWGENGCSIDPNGRCASAPVRPSGDAGCSLDPSGRCK